MGEVCVVISQPWHVAYIAERMREADRQECWAWALMTPMEALTQGYEESDLCFTGLYDQEPVCMFGVCRDRQVIGNGGTIWLLGTPALETYQVSFLRYCQRYMPVLCEGLDRVGNYVDARNKKSIRWLKWLGFEVDPDPVPAGLFRLPFHKFEKAC